MNHFRYFSCLKILPLFAVVYYFAEATGRAPGDVAYLVSPSLPDSHLDYDKCLTFNYNTYGFHFGAFRVMDQWNNTLFKQDRSECNESTAHDPFLTYNKNIVYIYFQRLQIRTTRSGRRLRWAFLRRRACSCSQHGEEATEWRTTREIFQLMTSSWSKRFAVRNSSF